MKVARNFFTHKEQLSIVDAIKAAELNTSGEIRVHIGNFCFGNEQKCAQKIFKQLKMHQTKYHNGVLIYISAFHKKIAIIGDEGIHQKLGAEYWNNLIQNLITHFKANHKGRGLIESIQECGHQLSTYFPKSNDLNELKNEIDY